MGRSFNSFILFLKAGDSPNSVAFFLLELLLCYKSSSPELCILGLFLLEFEPTFELLDKKIDPLFFIISLPESRY